MHKKIIIRSIIVLFLSLVLMGMLYIIKLNNKIEDRIHMITTPLIGTDAIILESSGKFAMIDTGEDEDFPDGTYPQYPLRPGVVVDKKKAITDRVFAHLKKLGVNQLEFIIITHAHSDHIGNASKIIENIPTKKIYIKKYTDDRITSKNRLWDSQYCYDKTIEAAKKHNVEIVQDITPDMAKIKLNNMNIQLYNYENEYENDKLREVWDDNVNSIVSVVEVKNKKFFFGGDLDNTDGREDKYADIIGKVDVMKLNHHGDVKLSNTKNFVEKLSPQIIVKTQARDIEQDYIKWLKYKKIKLLTTGRSDISALVLGISKKEIKDISSKYGINGIYKDKGNLKFKLWNDIDAKNTWILSDGDWYYANSEGLLKIGWFKEYSNEYYFDKNAKLIKDTTYEIDNKIYKFDELGRLIKE